MSGGIANFLDLEQLAQELVVHSSDYLVEKQVLIDAIQATFDGKAARLDDCSDSFDILRCVLNIFER